MSLRPEVSSHLRVRHLQGENEDHPIFLSQILHASIQYGIYQEDFNSLSSEIVSCPSQTQMKLSIAMFSAAAASLSRRSATAFVVSRTSASTRTLVSSTRVLQVAAEGQAEVVLVGCGAPNRGMGWYHAVQMLDQK